jgi:hypothetical protein
MTIGIEQFRTHRDLWLDRMLFQPLRGASGTYPINRARNELEGNKASRLDSQSTLGDD